jgi:hypothetical protein
MKKQNKNWEKEFDERWRNFSNRIFEMSAKGEDITCEIIGSGDQVRNFIRQLLVQKEKS